MNPFFRFIGLVIVLMISFYSSSAQPNSDDAPPLVATFEAYNCEFVADTNQVNISTSLVGANGLPVPITDVNLSVTPIGDTVPLISDDVAIATITQRPPLQMIIVLDTTETVPVAEIVGQMVEVLFPRLPVEDQVALITFSQEIQPRTAFYTDKNRLVNEHVLDLQVLEGDNRLYAAMLQSTTSFQLESDARQVVLVLSDSGRRESDDTPVEEIITRAQINNVQMYLMGFYTLDVPRPDRADFFAIANGTGGYAWFYDQPYISRTDVSEQVGRFLNEFVDTLNSELSITIDLQGLDTGSANFVEFNLRADTANDMTIETTVSCPIERLNHSINFADDLNDVVVRGTLDVGVITTSDFAPEDTDVRFKLNGDSVWEGSSIYRFDSADHTPGYYTIIAELLDEQGNILATTPTSIRVFAQHNLDFYVTGNPAILSGTATLNLQAPDGAEDLDGAEFTVASATNPDDERVLASAIFDENDTATYVTDDIDADIRALFPEESDTSQYIFGGRVPGLTTDQPLFAVADDVSLDVVDNMATPIPTQVVSQVAPEPETAERQSWVVFLLTVFENQIWLLIGLIFFIINILLFRAVRRARIRKLIAHPDDYDLNSPLMTVTVYNKGLNQSHSLTRRTIFLGRGSSNDINLGSDSNISRNHGVLMWRNGEWLYTNRKSKTFAIINDRKRKGFIYCKMTAFTEILIGNSLIVFHENTRQDVADFVKTDI